MPLELTQNAAFPIEVEQHSIAKRSAHGSHKEGHDGGSVEKVGIGTLRRVELPNQTIALKDAVEGVRLISKYSPTKSWRASSSSIPKLL